MEKTGSILYSRRLVSGGKIGVPIKAPKDGAGTGIIGDSGMVVGHVIMEHIALHHVTCHVGSPFRRWSAVFYVGVILTPRGTEVNR